MPGVRVVTDTAECRRLWENNIPAETIWDIWEFRECFHSEFKRPVSFLVIEDDNAVKGLLPLCWIEESKSRGYFPGETWKGKTWIEQNRILLRNNADLQMMLSHQPEQYHLRYLLAPDHDLYEGQVQDETGYLFIPSNYDYNMENYFLQFSHKKAKQLKKEVAAFEEKGLTFRYDNPADFNIMVDLNLGRFGESSYFYDARFLNGFRNLLNYLMEKKWLRMTTVIVNEKVAAVDMGCIYNNDYTLLAGGTHQDFPGIAKLINLHHMQRACREKLRQVDFLCGDFSWKTLFHLTPRPLYLLSNVTLTA